MLTIICFPFPAYLNSIFKIDFSGFELIMVFLQIESATCEMYKWFGFLGKGE